MTQQEISNRIRKIEWVLEHEPDLSQNRVMALGGEWAGLKKCLVDQRPLTGSWTVSMWAMLHRLRGI